MSDTTGAEPVMPTVMPENSEASLQFPSCAAKVEALEAVFLAISAATALASQRGWIAAIGLLFGSAWLGYRAHLDRGRSYVEVCGDQIIVNSGGGCRRKAELSLVAGVRRGWNKTVLHLNNGTNVAIDHTWFVTGSKAQRFRAYVEKANGRKQS
jgi:hypothetical protein